MRGRGRSERGERERGWREKGEGEGRGGRGKGREGEEEERGGRGGECLKTHIFQAPSLIVDVHIHTHSWNIHATHTLSHSIEAGTTHTHTHMTSVHSELEGLFVHRQGHNQLALTTTRVTPLALTTTTLTTALDPQTSQVHLKPSPFLPLASGLICNTQACAYYM